MRRVIAPAVTAAAIATSSGPHPGYHGNSGFCGYFWLLWLPFSSV